jgi:hypothetical protein
MPIELLDRKRWNTRVELANTIFEYIEVLSAGGITLRSATSRPSSSNAP